MFLFDLNALGLDGNSQVCSEAKRILGELFSRRDVIKVGWDFGAKDMEKLQCSGGATGAMDDV